MNASEVLKGFAMKQVYGYLDKDPDTNIPKHGNESTAEFEDFDD